MHYFYVALVMKIATIMNLCEQYWIGICSNVIFIILAFSAETMQGTYIYEKYIDDVCLLRAYPSAL